jgi:NAD(P)-dependent dehydrogenase (short-subunit alcohol dehydrogenase family)
MSKRLEGKTALVTGATSNIGRSIAEAFAAQGAHVVVSGRSAGRGKEVVDGIRARGGRADFVQADLDGSAAASQALAREATRVLGGRIDILVNNAGIFPSDTTAATDEKTFDQVYAVNVKAPFFLTAAVAPAMAEAGSGAIINLGSWIARLGIPVSALYSSTKGAVETLTRAWGGGVRAAGRPGERDLAGRRGDARPRRGPPRRGHDEGHPRRPGGDPRCHRERRRLPGQ